MQIIGSEVPCTIPVEDFEHIDNIILKGLSIDLLSHVEQKLLEIDGTIPIFIHISEYSIRFLICHIVS